MKVSQRENTSGKLAEAAIATKQEISLEEIARLRAEVETANLMASKFCYVAEHDFLTGLPNRALLTDRLEQAIAFAQRHGKKIAVLFLDLDHFKHINDAYGHTVGDQLLQAVAKRLQTCVRLSDTVSRQGGDEFVVLLTEIQAIDDAILTAEKLIAAVAQPYVIGDHKLGITLSIGISLYPDDSKDIETILGNADMAMYQAKKNGSNNYQVFTSDLNLWSATRLSIEHGLRQGLDRHEFVLHYQPQLNLETGCITGVEALLRLQRPDCQLVCPQEFLSVAQECGLMQPIGKWVLYEACRQAQAWLHNGLALSQMAVNVSAAEFHGKDFLSTVCHTLEATGLDPHHLELDLTESGLLQDSEPTMELLHDLKQLGVQIAIDNFGTGYSTLSCLRRFPIDTLKIDPSLLRDIDDDGGEAIVSAIIAMGMSLKQRVVAEGIETRHQLTFLQSHCCAEGLGFFLGQPVTAEVFGTLPAIDHH